MSYPTADIRKFLMEVFSDEELEVFCFDHFPEVANDFGSGMSKAEKVQLLIEYCQRREQFPALLSALEATRPQQYQQHLGDLTHANSSSPQSAPAPTLQKRTLLIAVSSLAGLLLVALVVTLLLRGANPAALPPSNTPQPTPTMTSQPSPTTTPTEAPTQVLTQAPPPDFTTLQVLHIEAQMETQVQPGAQYTDAIHLLELREVSFVQLRDTQYGYRVLLAVRNTTSETIRLALKPNYFGLEDEQGRTARLIYFCCAKPVDLLDPGQAREVVLFFEDDQDWGTGGKGGPDHFYMVVRGLLPVVRMAWLIRLLATAA